MEYNLQKLWITMLYTWKLYNIIHQLYLNKKVFEKEPKLGLGTIKDTREIYLGRMCWVQETEYAAKTGLIGQNSYSSP